MKKISLNALKLNAHDVIEKTDVICHPKNTIYVLQSIIYNYFNKYTRGVPWHCDYNIGMENNFIRLFSKILNKPNITRQLSV